MTTTTTDPVLAARLDALAIGIRAFADSVAVWKSNPQQDDDAPVSDDRKRELLAGSGFTPAQIDCAMAASGSSSTSDHGGMTESRRRELLAMTGLGQNVLKSAGA